MNTPDLFQDISRQSETVAFIPTRAAGLERLGKFVSRTASHYTHQRNYDLGPGNRSTVSVLSPWIKHRLISEEEVLRETLARHSLAASMKFVQEVFWRGYFKGWLEQHPSVWHSYQNGASEAVLRLEKDAALKTDYDEATSARTGIDCFDHWCRELQETGYLHNHTRMWFASIWIFTLRLPWELGAAFFLRHLVDGDPAANTLSWRWVAGLHTKGKTYLARSSNIAKFTDGQFEPIGQLSHSAEPLTENIVHPLVPLTPPSTMPKDNYLLLVTPEDCSPESFISGNLSGVLGLSLPLSEDHSAQVNAFSDRAVKDALTRSEIDRPDLKTGKKWSAAIIEAAQASGARNVVTPWLPVGPVATQMESVKVALRNEGIALNIQQRKYDTNVWPFATKGFFMLKKKIPDILGELEQNIV